jgi:hypothetical protein
MKMAIFSFVAPCSLVEVYQCFTVNANFIYKTTLRKENGRSRNFKPVQLQWFIATVNILNKTKFKTTAPKVG